MDFGELAARGSAMDKGVFADYPVEHLWTDLKVSSFSKTWCV